MINTMTKILIIIALINVLTNCNNSNYGEKDEYTLISYLDIKIDSSGRLPKVPYVVNLEKGKKHLIVIGTLHSRDTSNQMFKDIEKIFINKVI